MTTTTPSSTSTPTPSPITKTSFWATYTGHSTYITEKKTSFWETYRPTKTPIPTAPPRRPSDVHKDHFSSSNPDGGGATWGWVLLSLLLLVLIAGFAWYLYAHLRARRLGVPGPRLNPFSDHNRASNSASRSGGLVGWAQDKVSTYRRQRTAGGAYEGTTGTVGRRGRGMDPDEAWDTRVGNEADIYGPPGAGAYYEEQELSGLRGGLHDESTYAGGGYGRPGAGYGPTGGLDEIEIGETRGRKSELDKRYDDEMRGTSQNPFDDDAEPSDMSLRGVSPRPHEEDSPTERRSMFKENV